MTRPGGGRQNEAVSRASIEYRLPVVAGHRTPLPLIDSREIERRRGSDRRAADDRRQSRRRWKRRRTEAASR